MNNADDHPSPQAHLHLDALTVSRRDALQGGAALALAPLAATPAAAQGSRGTSGAPALPAVHRLRLSTTVNARRFEGDIDARSSLLDLLRERMSLTGAKKGCDHGQCGACTVHVDGRRVASCLTLAAKVQGREVLTIEGLSDGEELHPMQQAFIDHDALQCGYCTPGQIMAAKGYPDRAGEFWAAGLDMLEAGRTRVCNRRRHGRKLLRKRKQGSG